MRTLIVGQDLPWPPAGGGLIRLSQVVHALSEISQVDFFALLDERRSPLPPPESIDLCRATTAPYPRMAPAAHWRARWMADRGLPAEVAMRSFDTRARDELARWALAPYDLVWFSTAAVFEWMARPRLGPTIVDIDNLEDESARRRSQVAHRNGSGAGLAARWHGLASRTQLRLDASSWTRFQASVASSVERVVLCSDLDIARSGLSNATVVPNVYERPSTPVGRRDVGDPPVVLFQGRLNYPPNIDAVDFVVDKIAPLLWERVPSAQLRLVGRPTPAVKRRHHPPHVVVVGKVPEIEWELATADVAIVPLRFGSGTRLKILESFAHRVPVVSTPLGAEGLEVEDGLHLVLASSAEELAEGCARVLLDRELRDRLVGSAQALFLERYDWPVAEERLQSLAREVAASRRRSASN
jgi:glycosyltransferase involved in cell wall biosynthesis